MVRRHLALSIALASILSLVAGGLAFAALTPEGKVTVCVTSEGFVRSANFNNKCPYKSKPVLLDKSLPTPTPNPPEDNAVEVVGGIDVPEQDVITILEFEPLGKQNKVIASTPVIVEQAGFFKLEQSLKEVKTIPPSCLGQGDYGANAGDSRFVVVDSQGDERSGWLEEGEYAIELWMDVYGCPAIAESGTGRSHLSNAHARLAAY